MKKEITHKGQKYISTKQAALLSGYGSDYIGQLARAGKIRSRLFGNARFVCEADLVSYGGKDDIILNGEKYISTSDAANHAEYTQDYIGQLARSGKVGSSIVGRIRFIKESDLISYVKNNKGNDVAASIEALREDSAPVVHGKKEKNIILVPIKDAKKELSMAKSLFQGANFVTIDVSEHDKKIGVILNIKNKSMS